MKSNMLDMKIKKPMRKGKKDMPVNAMDQKRVAGYASGGSVARGGGCAVKGTRFTKNG